jgi:hypothetical protein
MKDYSVRSAYDLARIESFFFSRSATKLGGSSEHPGEALEINLGDQLSE